MKSFSLKKSIFSILVLTSLGIGQARGSDAETPKKDVEKETFSETLLKIQPSINNTIKTTYKIAKKSIMPLCALYLFIKYVSPLGKQCFGSKNEEPTAIQTKSLDDFTKLSNDTEKLNDIYSAVLANNVLANKKKDDKSPEFRAAIKYLDALLGVFIMDPYIKAPFKAIQEALTYYIEKGEEKLGLA